MSSGSLHDGTGKPIHSAVVDVRWGDMDAFNHVNNVQYLRFLEEARVQWLASLPGVSLNDRISPVLVSSHVNFRKSIGWPESLVIDLFVEKIGNSSLTMGHRILSTADWSVVYSDGNVVMVWVDAETGKSTPLPDAVRTALIDAG